VANPSREPKEFDRTMDFVSALIDTARKLNSGGAICQALPTLPLGSHEKHPGVVLTTHLLISHWE